jgi:hypothetical protein
MNTAMREFSSSQAASSKIIMRTENMLRELGSLHTSLATLIKATTRKINQISALSADTNDAIYKLTSLTVGNKDCMSIDLVVETVLRNLFERHMLRTS